MSFADAYLLKAGLRGKLIETEPHPELKIIVTIPVFNESGLERCLDSLFQCQQLVDLPADTNQVEKIRAEVFVLINAPFDAPEVILKQNLNTYNAALKWKVAHPHPFIDFYVLQDHTFEKKEAGVGLARKILMDEAVRRFGLAGHAHGIIASMDADAVVEYNYLEAIVEHFAASKSDGCSIYFEHPISSGMGEHFEPEVYNAITQYELHLRYYLQAVRSTGYPNAYHTVGSSFAVKADVYCMEGGMNRRQGGEDFYFIQKVAQRGNFSECNATRVIPSPRPSDRVPFGTGPVVGKIMKGSGDLSTYDPRLFGILRHFFSGLEIIYSEDSLADFMKSQSIVLLKFLETQQFEEALAEIRKNSASYPAFQKRFWRWFNMFRIMKFLHHAREKGYANVLVGEASLKLLEQMKPEGIENCLPGNDLRKLLLIYRQMER